MYSTRFIQLLLVALSVFSIAQAFVPEAEIYGRRNDEMIKRQKSGDSSSTKPSPSPTASQTKTSPSTTPTGEPTSPTPTPTGSGSSPTPSDTGKEPTTSSTSSTGTPTDRSTSSQAPSTSTVYYTTTAADGSPTSFASETVITPTPTISANSNGSTSGMSTTTRNTIIGVVVGVGGAIILGVIALVAWRIWGRKKAQEQDDGMMNYGGSSFQATEKSEAGGSSAGTARSPFQSTLESYHAPTQVNQASNF